MLRKTNYQRIRWVAHLEKRFHGNARTVDTHGNKARRRWLIRVLIVASVPKDVCLAKRGGRGRKEL